jgi:hypothetical protein
MQGCILPQQSKILRDLLKQRSEAADFFAFRDRESASVRRLPRPMYYGGKATIVAKTGRRESMRGDDGAI